MGLIRIQTAKVAENLTRFFQLRGQVDPKLDDTIVPVVSVGDVGPSQPPAASRSWIAGGRIAGVGGQFSGFDLECPPGTLATIDWMSWSPVAQTDMRAVWNRQAQYAVTAVLAEKMDGRLTEESPGATVTNSACRVYADALQAALLNPYTWSVWIPVTDNAPIYSGSKYKWLLYCRPDAPTSRFASFACATAGIALDWSIGWTEYSVPEIMPSPVRAQ